MNNVHRLQTVCLLVALAATLGCQSKQEKPAATAGPGEQKGAAPAATATPEKPAAPVNVPPRDKADAQAAAERVLALLESGDFPAIYQGAAPMFKQLGTEDQFVAKFQQTRDRVGLLKNPQPMSFGTLPGNGYVFVYRVTNERYQTDMRLTFLRSKAGKMELAGLNQHDEPRK